MKAVDLDQVFAGITTHWEPQVAGELNGQHVKCVKLLGDFIWHHHEVEDELFLVHRGTLRMELRDGTVLIGPGQFYIVPHGVEHRPCAPAEVALVLFEPISTVNTGNLTNERTRTELRRIAS